jgi:hypothetical protein
MTSFANKYQAPVAVNLIVVSVSVSSQASAVAAGIGPFRGLLFKASASTVSFVGNNGFNLTLTDPNPSGLASSAILWVEGSFVSAITTATAVYAVY